MVDGNLNLVLFRQLFWTVFWSFFVMGIWNYPISRMVMGTYSDSLLGKVCILKPLEMDEEMRRSRLCMIAYLGIA